MFPPRGHLLNEPSDTGERMRMMMNGLTGWLRFENTKNESVRVADTALTVVATLLVAVTYVMVR